MKLFLIVVTIYMGIEAVVTFIKARIETEGESFPLAVRIDIIISLGLMGWGAVVLLVR